MKAVCYLSVKFTKLTVLNLGKSDPWEAGSIVIKIVLKVLYCYVNIVLNQKFFKGPNIC